MIATTEIALREQSLAGFFGAMATRDAAKVYEVVAPDFVWRLPIGPNSPHARDLSSREQLAQYLQERTRIYSDFRALDKKFYHAQAATFMSFRIEAVRRRDNARVDALALERFLFRRGSIVELDVYWKSVRDESCWWVECSRSGKVHAEACPESGV